MFEIITARLLEDGNIFNHHVRHEDEYTVYHAFNQLIAGAVDDYYVLIQYYGNSWKIADEVALNGSTCAAWFVSSTEDGLKVVESHAHRMMRERM